MCTTQFPSKKKFLWQLPTWFSWFTTICCLLGLFAFSFPALYAGEWMAADTRSANGKSKWKNHNSFPYTSKHRTQQDDEQVVTVCAVERNMPKQNRKDSIPNAKQIAKQKIMTRRAHDTKKKTREKLTEEWSSNSPTKSDEWKTKTP